MEEKLKAKGLVSFVLRGPDGKVKQTEVTNMVMNAGIAFIISRMKDTTYAAVSHTAVGTLNTAAAATQTTMAAETTRVANTSATIGTTNVTNDSITYVAEFAAGVASVAITEAGLFNASSGGTMIARTVFAAINKGVLDSLTITWKLTIT